MSRRGSLYYISIILSVKKQIGLIELRRRILASPETKGMKQKNKYVEKSVSMGRNYDLERLEPPKNHNFLRKCDSGERYVEKMPSLKSEST